MKLFKSIAPLTIAALVLAPLQASALTGVQGGPYKDLEPTGAIIRLALTNFPTMGGLYIQQCVAPTPGAKPTDCNTVSLWVSTDANAPTKPTGEIQVKPTAKFNTAANKSIDCTVVSCGLWFAYDHTKPMDRSEDQFIPITFKSAGDAVALPGDTVTGSVKGIALDPRNPVEIAYQGPVKIVTSSLSGTAVTLASSTADCTTKKNTVIALKGTGFCNITATSAGNSKFSSKTANFTLKLVPGVQIISKKNIKSLKANRFSTLASETNFGESITYTSTTPTTCKVRGVRVTGIAKGDCVITATAAEKAETWQALDQSIKLKIK